MLPSTFHLPITRPHRVIYSMTEVRDLQLARNDKAAASGLMTEARQSRNPAACAPSGAWVRNRGVHPSVDVGHFALATFPASNPAECSGFKVRSNRSLPPERECLSTQTAYHNGKETAPTPALKGGASAPEKGEVRFGVCSASVWTQDGRARRDRRDPSRERDDHQYYRATTAHVLRSCSGPLSAVWDADCAVCVPYGIEGPSARLEACWCWGETSQAIAGQHQYASAHQGVR